MKASDGPGKVPVVRPGEMQKVHTLFLFAFILAMHRVLLVVLWVLGCFPNMSLVNVALGPRGLHESPRWRWRSSSGAAGRVQTIDISYFMLWVLRSADVLRTSAV